MTRLTRTQTMIVGFVVSGLSLRAIAKRLQRSPRTVEKHLENIALQIPGDPMIPRKTRILLWGQQQKV